MKIDLYTKFVLTVIALALLGMLFKPIFVSKGANASDGYGQKKEIVDVNIKEIGGVPFSVSMFPALPVRVEK